MVGFLIIHICETFVKHETKISGWLEPLIHTIKVNDQFSEGRFVDFLPSSSSNFFFTLLDVGDSQCQDRENDVP